MAPQITLGQRSLLTSILVTGKIGINLCELNLGFF